MIPIATRTEAGDRGEDRLVVRRTPAVAQLTVVADGAGGVSGAAPAAQAICDFIWRARRRRSATLVSGPTPCVSRTPNSKRRRMED